MKILLVGEFSNVHWTLAEGLRQLGQEVCVVSDGNNWKNYPRDINLQRASNSKMDAIKYIAKLLYLLPSLRGYDVVQIVNPCFLNLRPEKSLYIYRYLRKHNKKIFLGAFGTDYYYVKACMEGNVFKYSDFKTGNVFRDNPENREAVKENLTGGTALATKEIAETCNGVIACLWEYYISYKPYYNDKLTFIPLPINISSVVGKPKSEPEKINIFIGIQSARTQIKGTDIMLPVVRAIAKEYSDCCTVTEAVDVPYAEYQKLLEQADIQIDQLYAYTPSMNSLLAMVKGVIVCGGGEPENYDIINEKELRPIINISPNADELYDTLKEMMVHKERIPELSAQSIEYVKRHHDHVQVAQQYLDFWNLH